MKYGKYLTQDCVKPNKMKEGKFLTSTRHLENFGGDISVDCIFISDPHIMIPEPHRHEFPQYLHFFSANFSDPRDFDAEIHVTLGEEQEKHIIKTPTAVHVPAGLFHGPIEFVKVNKPLLFIDVAVTSKYSRVGEKSE